MFYYSKNCKGKIVHYAHCCYSKMIEKQNIGYFSTLEEAQAAGYRVCNRCAPIRRFIRGEEKAINEYCQQNGMLYYLEDGCIIVKTPHSAWKIIIVGKSRKHIFLYHRNTHNSNEKSTVPGYHCQSVRKNTVLEYMEYIVAHEEYRYKKPLAPKKQSVTPPPQKGTKRWRKEQKHLQHVQRKENIRHTLYLIELLNSKEKRIF